MSEFLGILFTNWMEAIQTYKDEAENYARGNYSEPSPRYVRARQDLVDTEAALIERIKELLK